MFLWQVTSSTTRKLERFLFAKCVSHELVNSCFVYGRLIVTNVETTFQYW